MSSFRSLLLLVLTIITSPLYAASPELLLTLGAEAGGDDLVETTQEDLQAGGGYFLGAGLQFKELHSDLRYMATINYRRRSVDFVGPSGEATMEVMPLELFFVKDYGKSGVGGGLAYHINPEYELCIDSLGCGTTKFDNALGVFVLWALNIKNSFIGFRYTHIEYDSSIYSVDASGLGIVMGTTF